MVGQRRRTGQAERVRYKPGPKSRMTPEIATYLQAQVGRQPDLTLAELQRLLAAECEVRFRIGQLWALLRSLDLRLKKSRSTRPSATRKPSGRSVRNISNGSNGLTRNG